MVFTNLTWLLVGSSSTQFSTAGEAWRSVIRVSLGEYENFYPQILAAQPTVGPVIVVLYQVLGVVLLLHVVIAVLLEVRHPFCCCYCFLVWQRFAFLSGGEVVGAGERGSPFLLEAYYDS